MTDSSKLSIEQTLAAAFGQRSSFANFVGHPNFWPIALKGGCENTIRDIILADINSNLPPCYVCSGERTRRDIVVYQKDSISSAGSAGRDLGDPIAVVELKFNFITQQSELKQGTNAFRALAIDGPAQFAVVHVLCDILSADALSRALVRRYVPSKHIDASVNLEGGRRASFDAAERLFRDELAGVTVRRSEPFPISDGTTDNVGMVTAFLMKPARVD